MKRAWWHRLLLVTVAAAALAGAATLGWSSVRTWMEQSDQQAAAERVAADLDARIADLEDEIDRRTSEEGVRREALCFGPYVEPGTEVYAVMGLRGCVTGQQGIRPPR